MVREGLERVRVDLGKEGSLVHAEATECKCFIGTAGDQELVQDHAGEIALDHRPIGLCWAA